jgi:propanol-preferring alcohol dehydrogenase
VKAIAIHKHAQIENRPLRTADRDRPQPGPGQLLIRVSACGVCHTDLHTVEGEIRPPGLPVVPGHQVVGIVESAGTGSRGWSVGQRAGVPWLHGTCGSCASCTRGEENLCPRARFTGFHVDGGYAEYLLADADFALHLPEQLGDAQAAPLLCAGIIGYRSLRVAGCAPGDRLGLAGFGASAHLAIQVARHWGCNVFVFTRSEEHRNLARELGAAWVGGAGDAPPEPLDRAVIFAPAGRLVPLLLEKIRPGGTLAINAIHMSPFPEMPYRLLYGERSLRSVTNATRRDGREFLDLAVAIPVRATVRAYPLEEANAALLDLKKSRIRGSGVLLPA